MPNLEEALVLGPEKVTFDNRHMKILTPSSLDKISLRELPLYVSIDKDILSREELKLGWEQGTRELVELLEFLSLILFQNVNLIGADVCGEPFLSPADFSLEAQAQIKRSEKINLEIARLFLDFMTFHKF